MELSPHLLVKILSPSYAIVNVQLYYNIPVPELLYQSRAGKHFFFELLFRPQKATLLRFHSGILILAIVKLTS